MRRRKPIARPTRSGKASRPDPHSESSSQEHGSTAKDIKTRRSSGATDEEHQPTRRSPRRKRELDNNEDLAEKNGSTSGKHQSKISKRGDSSAEQGSSPGTKSDGGSSVKSGRGAHGKRAAKAGDRAKRQATRTDPLTDENTVSIQEGSEFDEGEKGSIAGVDAVERVEEVGSSMDVEGARKEGQGLYITGKNYKYDDDEDESSDRVTTIERFFAGRATLADLPLLEARGEYELLIVSLRKFIRTDIRVLTDAWVKSWIARRWRNFFISIAASTEPKAIKFATEHPTGLMGRIMGLEDLRSPEERIASRFLVLVDDSNKQLLFSPGTKSARRAKEEADAAASAGSASPTANPQSVSQQLVKSTLGLLPFKGIGVDGVSYFNWTNLKRKVIEVDPESDSNSNSNVAKVSNSVSGELHTDKGSEDKISIHAHSEKHRETPLNPKKHIVQEEDEVTDVRIILDGQSGTTQGTQYTHKKQGTSTDSAGSEPEDIKINASTNGEEREDTDALWDFPKRSGIGLLSEWAFAVRDEKSIWWRSSVDARNGQRPLPLAQLPLKKVRDTTKKFRKTPTHSKNSSITGQFSPDVSELGSYIEKVQQPSNSGMYQSDNGEDEVDEEEEAIGALDFAVNINPRRRSSLKMRSNDSPLIHGPLNSSIPSKSQTLSDYERPLPMKFNPSINSNSSNNVNNRPEFSKIELREASTDDTRPEHTSLCFCPGLLNGMIPLRAFQEAFPKIENEYGIKIRRVDAHPLRDSLDNVVDFDDFFNGIRQRNAAGKRIRWKNKYDDKNDKNKDESATPSELITKRVNEFNANLFQFTSLSSFKNKMKLPSYVEDLRTRINESMAMSSTGSKDSSKPSITNDIKDYIGLTLDKWKPLFPASIKGSPTPDSETSTDDPSNTTDGPSTKKRPSTIQDELHDFLSKIRQKAIQDLTSSASGATRLAELAKIFMERISSTSTATWTQKGVINDKEDGSSVNIESSAFEASSVQETEGNTSMWRMGNGGGSSAKSVLNEHGSEYQSTFNYNSLQSDMSESETDYDDTSSDSENVDEYDDEAENGSRDKKNESLSSTNRTDEADGGISTSLPSAEDIRIDKTKEIPTIVIGGEEDKTGSPRYLSHAEKLHQVNKDMRGLHKTKRSSQRDKRRKLKFQHHMKQIRRRKYVPICYSKGIVDFLEYIVRRPERKKQINAIFCYAGAIYGSHLADEFFEVLSMLPDTYRDMDPRLLTRSIDMLWPLLDMNKLDVFSRVGQSSPIAALRDLSTFKRLEFMEKHGSEFQSSNGWNIPFFCITGATTPGECPYFQKSAFEKLSRYDVLNDMQLITNQGIMKSDLSTHLAVVRAHHWDMSFTAFPQMFSGLSQKLKHPFPKHASASAMTLLAMELGLL